jgi:hypothetical protein
MPSVDKIRVLIFLGPVVSSTNVGWHRNALEAKLEKPDKIAIGDRSSDNGQPKKDRWSAISHLAKSQHRSVADLLGTSCDSPGAETFHQFEPA